MQSGVHLSSQCVCSTCSCAHLVQGGGRGAAGDGQRRQRQHRRPDLLRVPPHAGAAQLRPALQRHTKSAISKHKFGSLN